MVENFKWYFLGSYPNISDVGCGGGKAFLSLWFWSTMRVLRGSTGRNQHGMTTTITMMVRMTLMSDISYSRISYAAMVRGAKWKVTSAVFRQLSWSFLFLLYPFWFRRVSWIFGFLAVSLDSERFQCFQHLEAALNANCLHRYFGFCFACFQFSICTL